MGRDAKTDRGRRLLFAVYTALRRISREEGIAPTLRGIADQLNARGLRTNRGKLFDAQKVAAALDKLGVDRVSIKRWRQQARDRAREWGTSVEDLHYQLWHEWIRHVTISREPFVPNLIHPDDWIPPWERDVEPDWRFMHPSPPVRVVALFLGPGFEHEEGVKPSRSPKR